MCEWLKPRRPQGSLQKLGSATIKTGSAEGFFKRGREVARLADHGELLPTARVITYEDPEDLEDLARDVSKSLVANE